MSYGGTGLLKLASTSNAIVFLPTNVCSLGITGVRISSAMLYNHTSEIPLAGYKINDKPGL
ncbi:hypothetical protein PSFL111601_13880 [Pseudomonas floridensis]